MLRKMLIVTLTLYQTDLQNMKMKDSAKDQMFLFEKRYQWKLVKSMEEPLLLQS